MSAHRPLAGRVVVTTREQRGALDSLLAARGADVVHIPLIRIETSDAQRSAVAAAVAELEAGDWVIVTSRHGAAACDGLLDGDRLRLAAVGAATAAELEHVAGRPIDVVPLRQHAVALAESMPDGSANVVLAQADRADATLADALRDRGYRVHVVEAYSNVFAVPSAAERASARRADAVAFASGSAAESWVASFGLDTTPRVVAAIGPTTAAAAERAGIDVTAVADVHDLVGLAEAVTGALTGNP